MTTNLVCIAALIIMLPSFGRASNQKELRVRGTVLCVDENRSETECSADTDRFAIQSGPKRYYFSPQDEKSKIFKDARVRSREIEVRAWKQGEGTLEIIKVYSIHNGKRYDIHYYCEVCNITAYSGGPCWCCQQDFELRETEIP